MAHIVANDNGLADALKEAQAAVGKSFTKEEVQVFESYWKELNGEDCSYEFPETKAALVELDQATECLQLPPSCVEAVDKAWPKIWSELDSTWHDLAAVDETSIAFYKVLVLDCTRSVYNQASRDNPNYVFMAGGMAAGKTHVYQHMQKRGYFEEPCVFIDCDAIKLQLPRYQALVAAKDPSAASQVHKESALVAELVLRFCYHEKLSFVFDGTLSDAEWFWQLFHAMNAPVCILHVVADIDLVHRRAKRRGAITGRHVPEKWLMKTVMDAERGVRYLRLQTDKNHCTLIRFICVIDNNGPVPVVRRFWTNDSGMGFTKLGPIAEPLDDPSGVVAAMVFPHTLVQHDPYAWLALYEYAKGRQEETSCQVHTGPLC